MIYACCDERRREAIRDDGRLNAIDFLEVDDRLDDPDELRQRRLYVHLLRPIAPDEPSIHVRITGGERIRVIRITHVSVGSAMSPPVSSPPSAPADVLVVEVAEPGDFSTYTLHLLKPGTDDAPDGFDPMLSTVEFSFKAGCPSAFDCRVRESCPPTLLEAPEINYLARDYASFRQLMLDRFAVLAPEWSERNAADLGIAVVEVLAYVADYLAYEQDAIATEAYLRTARRRVSVKRHARLIDYFVHEGTNARAWVQIVLNESSPAKVTLELADAGQPRIEFLTRVPDLSPVVDVDSPAIPAARSSRPEVFEPIVPDADDDPSSVELHRDHNCMRFHTWGDERCCLPRGATRATLRGAFPDLAPGTVLVFVEEKGPLTGHAGDADPAHRHAVRLTSRHVTSDPAGGLFDTPPTQDAVPVTEIEWGPEDALPFPLCVSSLRPAGSGTALETDISIALGNIVLVDHGRTISGELLTPVPQPQPMLARVGAATCSACDRQDATPGPARYRPALANTPVTHAPEYSLDSTATSAAALMRWPARVPLPVVRLHEDRPKGATWRPAADLLAVAEDDKRFVLEVESDGRAYLRFGDGTFVGRPVADVPLVATYRVGNGIAGNVGRETIAHVVTSQPGLADAIARVWNPMPARGGRDPEGIDEVRQRAPSAFRVQDRAVTSADYAAVVHRFRTDVQKVAATFRWTGSWRTVFLTADRVGGRAVDEDFERELRAGVELYRMAGHDLEVDAPIPVALDIDMHVCVEPGYFVSDVRAALLDLFSTRTLPDGRKGLFHPDNFSFNQSVYLSPFYAAAQALPGVRSVDITRFERRGEPSAKGLDDGRLDMGPLEIPRLDNDPNFRERGSFTLTLTGGR